MRSFFQLIMFSLYLSCNCQNSSNESVIPSMDKASLTSILDTIWEKEQYPIRKRDSLIEVHGVDSKEAEVYQKIYRENHAINIKKIRWILDTYGWPDNDIAGERQHRTICNVLQHSDQITREHYLPMMKQAVLDKKLGAPLFVRAEDRLATDRGELQIYGGQMKYYPETESFNVWPVYDPVNIDKRRVEIGLGPIHEFLKARFDFHWDLEEQIQRTKDFEKEKKLKESKLSADFTGK